MFEKCRLLLQKSPNGLCEIEICNNRIGARASLNRCCALAPDLESMLRDEMLKILLQQYLPQPVVSGCSNMSVQNPDLLDDLVGAGEQLLRDREAERLCSRQIDDEIEFGGLLDWNIRGLGSV
jgi:hypothetical protein